MVEIQIFLTLIFVVGIVIVGLSFITLLKLKNDREQKYAEPKTIEDVYEAVNKGLNDINTSSEEFNQLVIHIFKEFDEKYQELMVLYDLINKKAEEINKIDKKMVFDNEVINNNINSNEELYIDNKIENNKSENNTIKINVNKKTNDVLTLSNKGLNVDEIAKELNIGKAEVELIINIGGK